MSTTFDLPPGVTAQVHHVALFKGWLRKSVVGEWTMTISCRAAECFSSYEEAEMAAKEFFQKAGAAFTPKDKYYQVMSPSSRVIHEGIKNYTQGDIEATNRLMMELYKQERVKSPAYCISHYPLMY